MKCIIIEGPQGSGKTTLANYLREKVEAVNLYRLSGCKDKGISGLEKSKKMYDALLKYMQQLEDVGVNLLFDRTFFTDYVYARLGYKAYSYQEVYDELLQRFSSLQYEIYYFSLYLKDTSLYEQRLKRDHHHGYQAFSKENSEAQQMMYREVFFDLKKYPQVHAYEIAMDDIPSAYQEIDRILEIDGE